MSIEHFERPSDTVFFGFCLLAAVSALVVVSYFELNAWLLFPVAILVLAALTLVDGYRRSRP
ncbi:hypothetical protein [Halorarius litoreus]|uniref:hypothetical protein n=1 Tax=Halorarius litoreus TaxID=2962676 RepID=UPI0020CE90FE|nr:hypothetical protein [Halorarius litoreus]